MYQSYGLSHIQLTVADLERSFRFYQAMFGMQELFRVGAHVVMIQTPGSHEVVTLNANPAHADQRGQMGGVAHFGFRLREPADMAALLEAAARAGGTPIEHGTRGADKEETWAFMTDPDGYEVEVFWAP